MPDADTTPLTYGQLSVWRVMADWPLDRWTETYLSTAVQVPAGTQLDRVARAFGVLCERHESLRTHFMDTPDGPVQRVRPTDVPVEVETCEHPGATRTEAEAAARRLVHEPFDRQKEFARRFVVVTDGGRAVYAVLVTDRIIADGFALHRLRRELTALLGGDAPDGRQWLAETPAQPRELALSQRSEANQPCREATLSHWRRLLKVLPTEPSLVSDEAGRRPRRIEAVLRSPRARSALTLTARRMGVPSHGILLALTSLVLGAVTGSPRVVHALQSSNRFTAPWRTVVSSMSQYAPLSLDLGAVHDTFAGYARYVQSGSMKAYRFGSYDIDAVTALVRAERGVTLGFDYFYDFTAHDVSAGWNSGTGDAGPGGIDTLRPHRRISPRFDLKVLNGPDMPIVVRADPLLISQPLLHALLAWYEEELQRLAVDLGVGVAAVLARCEDVVRGRSPASLGLPTPPVVPLSAARR